MTKPIQEQVLDEIASKHKHNEILSSINKPFVINLFCNLYLGVIALILYVPRNQLMSKIIPITRQKDVTIEDSRVKCVNYLTNFGTKCSMYCHITPQNNASIANRKLIIAFPGNIQKSYLEFYKHDIGNSIFNSKKDFIAIDYPNNVTTASEVENVAYIAILKALKAGYKPENIDIIGHSMGGCISLNIMPRLQKYLNKYHHGEKFASYTNHHSLLSIGHVFAGWSVNDTDKSQNRMIYIKQAIITTAINLIGKILNLSFDTTNVLKNDNLIPVKEKHIIQAVQYVNSDGEISYSASIANYYIQNDNNWQTEVKSMQTKHNGWQITIEKCNHDDMSKNGKIINIF